MRKTSSFAILVITVLLASGSGCAPTKVPFLTVQFCVRDTAGAAQLITALEEIASANHMDFADSSSATARSLEETGYRDHDRADGSPVINVGLLGKDGLFVGGGNLGLPGYQVQLGFTTGSDDAKSHRFADQVVTELERRWQLHALPPAAAARPMADCR